MFKSQALVPCKIRLLDKTCESSDKRWRLSEALVNSSRLGVPDMTLFSHTTCGSYNRIDKSRGIVCKKFMSPEEWQWPLGCRQRGLAPTLFSDRGAAKRQLPEWFTTRGSRPIRERHVTFRPRPGTDVLSNLSKTVLFYLNILYYIPFLTCILRLTSLHINYISDLGNYTILLKN